MAFDGRAYLEKLIADRLGAGRGQPAEGRMSGFNLAEIRGIALGLTAAGALQQQEMERFLADLERTLEATGWLTVVRHTVTISGEVDNVMPTMTAGSGVVRPEWQAAIVDPPVPVLLRVIPLAGRTLVIDDEPTTLISVDIWSTMVTLRLAREARDTRDLLCRLDGPRRWRGWDDTGTRLHSHGGSGTDSHGLYLEQVVLEPGPADHARTLTLNVEHDGRSQQLAVSLDPPASESPAAQGG